MLRVTLIAVLIIGQGIPTLARGLILCLHADGGFCLEQSGDCCEHEHIADTSDSCCAAVPSDRLGYSPAAEDLPCDCTHLALSDLPQLAGTLRRDVVRDDCLHLDAPALLIESVSPSAAVSLSLRLADRGLCGQSAALPFLEPVMLRC